jgi:recombination protein RecA
VRCGKGRQKTPPLEQAFKATDMLLQSGGFGLIVMDLSGVPERVVRRAPLSSWFRFSRVVEKQNTALVVVEQRPHAASCAGLVLEFRTKPAVWLGRLLTQFHVRAEVLRAREKKPAQSERPDFSLKSQWA